jgi:hypothetical protein
MEGAWLEAPVVKVIDFSISHLRPLFIIEMIPTNRGVSLVVSFIAVQAPPPSISLKVKI